MNRIALRGAAIVLGCSASLLGHDPITTKLTWTQEVSRIVYKHCASCHRAGGAAMPLTTYADARPWAKAIRDEVSTRRMPPWGAVPGIGEFQGDPSLTSPEIDMLIAWVEGGAPEGDPIYLPHSVPGDAATASTPGKTHSLTITRSQTLQKPSTLLAIQPGDLKDGSSLEAWAVLPDHSVKRLIWLRDYRKALPKIYVLREPIALPAQTQLRTSGPSATLLLR